MTKVVLVVLASAVAAVVVGVAVEYIRRKYDAAEEDRSEWTTASPSSFPAPPTLPPRTGKDVLLPTKLAPRHYDVTIRPVFSDQSDPSSFAFNGFVIVHLDVRERTDVITLHANQLNIAKESILVTSSIGGVVKVLDTTYDERLQFYRIALEAGLEAGTGVSVRVRFSGPIKDDLVGIYYSSYRPDSNTIRYLVASHLHPTNARKVFPCMDEPALKASFSVTIERRADMNSLSNTVLESSESLDGGWVADHYKLTPKMSTYLLAFVVSDFQCLDTSSASGKPVLVCARPNALEQARYAVSIAARIQDFYEGFYNIPYPMDRTVHVAVPDLGTGGMENWGCIIYLETELLYDPAASTVANKQRVAIVIAHELAHMWFGDIVTPAWWDDIWLNEGFASYMQYLGVHAVEPDWNMDAQFLPESRQRVLQTDALLSSHPIYQEVAYPDQIGELFDSISYTKGASIIRMMYHFLGDDVFQAGIMRYLEENQYSVTNHTQLFQVLSETSASMRPAQWVNVSAVMPSWILQMGYPVVHMAYDDATGRVTLTQQRFLTFTPNDSSFVQPSPFDYTWVVPVSVASDVQGFNTFNTNWLNESTGSLTTSPGARWIVGNPLQLYYYRVNYDDVMWKALIGQLMTNHAAIPAASRAQLIDDSFSMARPGWVRQETALEVSLYLANEMEYVPWTAAALSFSYLRRMLATSPTLELLQAYMQRQVQRAYNAVGWAEGPADSHLTRLLRVQVLGLACVYSHAHCLHEAAVHFRLLFNGSSLNVNLQEVTYCHGIAAGGGVEWRRAFERYMESNLATEQATIWSALGCTRHAYLLSKYLHMALAYFDFGMAIVSVARNPKGQQLAWDFMRLNWDTICQRFTVFARSKILAQVTESFSTQAQLEELKAFVEAKAGALGAAARQAVETTEANVAWRRANERSVTAWLQQQ